MFPRLDLSDMDVARENVEEFLGMIFRISGRQAKDVPREPITEPVKGLLVTDY